MLKQCVGFLILSVFVILNNIHGNASKISYKMSIFVIFIKSTRKRIRLLIADIFNKFCLMLLISIDK